MRVLGIDFGDRTIGLALSDALRLTAQPFGIYRRQGSEEDDRRYFQDLVARHDVGEIVVGLPLRMDGTAGTRAEKTRRFAAWLGRAVGLPILFWDERLTTREALSVLREQNVRGARKKAAEDQVSAVIILSAYLERKRSEGDAAPDR
ncbi:MAG: Holliday junction resolvase RuvX [Candidatus Aminicenantes bacterium]|nr:Holliday junction resolvase RuvX [Candidatus Aminicenantes bacterium]